MQSGGHDCRKRLNDESDNAKNDKDCSKEQKINHEKESNSDKSKKLFGGALRIVLVTATGVVTGIAGFHKIDEHLINSRTKKILTDNNNRGVKTKIEFNIADKSLINVENEKSKRVSGDSTNPCGSGRKYKQCCGK